MTITVGERAEEQGRSGLANGAMLLLFAATLFLSAFLLFAVQPMFARLVLPALGGSAAVWSVAMVFFQAVLLLGYAYAHALARLSPAAAAGIHLLVIAIAAFGLPIALPSGWGAPPETGTAIWLIGLFAAGVGLPFFAVAGNGPLLQAWFSRTGHPHGSDPYFLYGASNIGSFAALLAYPVLVEPLLGARAQSLAWTAGFAALAGMIALCGLVLVRTAPAFRPLAVTPATEAAPTIGRRSAWIGLAFVPSGLLVAVTAHLSTDIAAVPFLWVLPLALFLATFVLVFRANPLPPRRFVLAAQPIAVAILVLAEHILNLPLLVEAGLLLATYMLSALLCHGELYRLRPGPGRLTEFYLAMSLGGVLGGLFAGLIAPMVFSFVAEYPLLLAATLLCRPGLLDPDRAALRADLKVIVPALAIVGIPALFDLSLTPDAELPYIIAVAVLTGIALLERAKPLRFAGLMTATLVAAVAYQPTYSRPEAERSFYGVHRIAETADGRYRVLLHGTTVHGAMAIRDAEGRPITGRPEPLTYYWPGSGLGRTVSAVREKNGGLIGHVTVIGLGSGSLACASRPGEDWRFLEIDPVVVRIARDPDRFRFLSDCAPDAEISLGDARLTLATADDPASDLIVVDAFSSDSIPIHLMTREALALYRSRLAPGGVTVFHVSNRHMELASVVAALAEADGLIALRAAIPAPEGDPMRAGSIVVAVAAKPEDFGPLATDPAFTRLRPLPGIAAWTDDHADVLSAILRRFTGRTGYEPVE